MARPTMADTAAELLATERILTTEAIAGVVIERGQTRARHPNAAVRAALDADRRLHRLDDGRWTMPIRLLDGAVLTHELTDDEARAGALVVDPDLSPLWDLAMSGLELAGGGELTLLPREMASGLLGRTVRRAIAGPAGWLPTTPGAFLHLRIAGGRLRVTEGDRPADESRDSEQRLVDRAERCLLQDVPRWDEPGAALISHVVIQAVAGMPGLLDHPLGPVGDLLRAAGLEIHGLEVGLPGTDWAGRTWTIVTGEDIEGDADGPEPGLEEEVAALAEAADLSEADRSMLHLLLLAIDLETTPASIKDPENLRALGQFLRSPVLAELVGSRAWQGPMAASLAQRILEVAPAGHRCGALYVLSVAADAVERPEVAAEFLRETLRDDPDFGPSLVALARTEQDRDRYPEALALLRRAGVAPDDPQRAFLEAALRPAAGKVGRNEPCPCGSGRKSKACHPQGVGTERPSPGTRLIRKLHAWAEQPDNDAHVHDLLESAGVEPAHDVADEDASAWAMLHTFATDAMLFDEGGLERFLRVRGSLLPADEVRLAEEWRTSRRAVVEVRAVSPGVSVTVRDLVDGSVSEVPDRSMSRQLGTLDLLCARLLPDGAGGLLTGDAFLVPRGQRQHVQGLVESGDPSAILEWLADPFPRVAMRTVDGHETVFVTSVWRVADPDRVARGLAAALRPEGDGRFTWLVPRDGHDSIVGTIMLRGKEATIEAQSLERAAGLEAILRGAAPGMRRIRREEVGADEALRRARAKGGHERAARPELDPATDPELAAIMDEYIREHERRWVDESIPALGGLTPRQALADPAMRPELDAMLDDMEWQMRAAGGHGLMDPRRVRALLGMPSGPGHA